MRKIATIFFLMLCIKANSQVGFEDYYSEKDLLLFLQNAKTPAGQLDAAGVLAVNYKGVFKDSLAAAYLARAYSIAENSKDPKLKARAIWWDNRQKPDTLKSIKLLQFAKDYNLIEAKIAAYMDLSDFYIHDNLSMAEKNALEAKSLLDDWKADSTAKDSLKIEVYGKLAHAYVHKRDGINTSRYLLPLLDYAHQEKNEALQVTAIGITAQIYGEWDGQQKMAKEWIVKYYDFYKKRNKKNELIAAAWLLAVRLYQDGNKEQAALHFAEAEKLMDSLDAYGLFQVYIASNKLSAKLITPREFLQLIESHYNGHLSLPLSEEVLNKARIYTYSLRQLDSAKTYLWQYQTLVGRELAFRNDYYLGMLSYYYSKKHEYDSVISISLKSLANGERENNMLKQIAANWALLAAYQNKKDYKNALKYFTKAYNMENEVENLGNKDEVGLMQMQKQQEIMESAFNEQRKAQESERKRIQLQNRVRLFGLLGGILILIVVAGLLWRNNRQKQKSKTEIEKAYAELKSTQSQLIQSEKMASLGELTAGIAHEIQNPLNFVNNFSEVNGELLKELKTEAEKGNLEEVKAIANDIVFNSEKINHHGKRADAIVKGMLQHSRTSSGQKEPRDINELADEYLRLAYHGMRARDKSFNATTKTDFDNSIGKINVVPQEVGRVMLNLINNAFYAVDEKKKQNLNGYEPTVTVTTIKHNGKVEIKVKDNGDGIPQKVLDKIFQPFFTTKPTGQGTGLGLSLAYDIVTKGHGGELKVETKEGYGSEFTIQLTV